MRNLVHSTMVVLALGLAPMLVQGESVPVIAIPVADDRFVDSVEALGTLRANESAVLSTTITETIAEIRFEDEQRVAAGDILVVMTSREQLAQLEEAEADVAEAKRQFQRIQSLVEQGTESASLLDQHRREIDTANARLKAVEARLSDRLIMAPFDGVTGLRNVSVGSLLSPGDRITTIHDDSVMKLDFPVPETLLAAIAPGVPVLAQSRAYPDSAFDGEVASVDNEVDPVTRAIQVRARIPNPDGSLRPGMLMTVQLLVNARTSMVIPEEALLPLGRDNFVFVAEDGQGDGLQARRQKVQIGARRPGEVEILDGLEVGQQVITHGGLRLSDGQQITVRNEFDQDKSLEDILATGRTR